MINFQIPERKSSKNEKSAYGRKLQMEFGNLPAYGVSTLVEDSTVLYVLSRCLCPTLKGRIDVIQIIVRENFREKTSVKKNFREGKLP